MSTAARSDCCQPGSRTSLAISFIHGSAFAGNSSTTVTYIQSLIFYAPAQQPEDIHRDEYMAVNLIWNPVERVFFGIEYPYDVHVVFDRDAGAAHRLQISSAFVLP